MAEQDGPYVNEYGVSLFDLALDLYDCWLMDLPHVRSGRGGVVAGGSQPELVREVWPTVQQLCIRLEADGKGDLAARVERAFRDAEDYARGIDNYCESEQFDYHLWAYGDPALDTIPTVDAEPEVLLTQAEDIGECSLTEDLYFTAFEREWAAELGKRSTEIEIEKYGHPPTEDYAERTEMRAWACFWLAAQLHRKGLSHQQARCYLEQYLSSHMVVSETKYPIIHEALGRAYGMSIYPIAPLESEEVNQGLEGLCAVLVEVRGVLSAMNEPERTVPQQGTPTKQQTWSDDDPAYLHLSEAVKLTDGRLSLSALSRLLVPQGEVRYMRMGRRCRVHLGDFRRFLKGHQSDPRWAKIYLTYLSASGKGDIRFFWRCKACGYEYPEGPAATATCPKCHSDAEIYCKRPPEPTR
jgi:hypothetical protein